ncbi:cyclin-dependent kinase inhibitor 3 [Beta vulgaris subsp. vulgaris]|uniref:cyclin-dependent kinase inhibitor 3 n=1 Tax=Beta vulgaris subsp. vulgaris TaxID=3555 RepID=UPI002548F6CF|nr:cyclin-dependent kinase inhibitor 3 [Beta vulgaris subsp. vulgaris]
MGKYMKKGKITGDVAVMEIPQTTSLGVRTRARTLALQPNPELSYLQLRSRRLEKPPFQPKQDVGSNNNKNPNFETQRPSSKVRVNSASPSNNLEGRFRHFDDVGRCHVADIEEFHDLGAFEPSFGENNFDFDSRERFAPESTPCSLIRDADTIGTPGSTTRPTCSTAANRRTRNMHRAIPTNREMEEFFAGVEHHQQKLFVEKYNYDIMNDMPLPGRYEWVRVDN